MNMTDVSTYSRPILPVAIVDRANMMMFLLRTAICSCHTFLPRCMECQRGLAMRKGVRLSVRLSNAWIATKRKKDLSIFLYHTKNHLA